MLEALIASLPLVVPAVGFFALFLAFERSGRSPTTVTVIWAILIADSSLYASQNEVPTGLFHPDAAGLSFRIVDVAVVAALAARTVAGPALRWVSIAGVLWAAAIVWILASAALGVYNGNSGELVSFEAKAAIYLAAMALTAGVPFARYLRERRILRLVRVSAVIATVLVFADKTGVRIAADIPWLPLVDTGRLGSDAGTLFASIGIVALAMGAYDERDRARWLLPATPLITAGFAANQRAALLALLVSLAVLALYMARGRLKVRITPTETGLVALAAVACLLTPVVIQLQAGSTAPRVPYVPTLTQTLYGREKVLSAQERIDQLRAARRLIAERPIFGWGLGNEFTYYRVGITDFETTNLTHNILADLWRRTGVVGLLFFVAALGTTIVAGSRAWLGERETAQAALMLGSLAVVIGLIPKGLVENLFEKYRMVLLLGLMIGMVSSAIAASRATAATDRAAPG